MPTMTTTPTRTPVEETAPPYEQRLLLRLLGTTVAAAHAAGREFDPIVNDLLGLEMTAARLVDALREAEAA